MSPNQAFSFVSGRCVTGSVVHQAFASRFNRLIRFILGAPSQHSVVAYTHTVLHYISSGSLIRGRLPARTLSGAQWMID